MDLVEGLDGLDGLDEEPDMVMLSIFTSTEAKTETATGTETKTPEAKTETAAGPAAGTETKTLEAKGAPVDMPTGPSKVLALQQSFPREFLVTISPMWQVALENPLDTELPVIIAGSPVVAGYLVECLQALEPIWQRGVVPLEEKAIKHQMDYAEFERVLTSFGLWTLADKYVSYPTYKQDLIDLAMTVLKLDIPLLQKFTCLLLGRQFSGLSVAKIAKFLEVPQFLTMPRHLQEAETEEATSASE